MTHPTTAQELLPETSDINAKHNPDSSASRYEKIKVAIQPLHEFRTFMKINENRPHK